MSAVADVANELDKYLSGGDAVALLAALPANFRRCLRCILACSNTLIGVEARFICYCALYLLLFASRSFTFSTRSNNDVEKSRREHVPIERAPTLLRRFITYRESTYFTAPVDYGMVCCHEYGVLR